MYDGRYNDLHHATRDVQDRRLVAEINMNVGFGFQLLRYAFVQVLRRVAVVDEIVGCFEEHCVPTEELVRLRHSEILAGVVRGGCACIHLATSMMMLLA